MKKAPKISVIMPVFNGQEFLAEAIESILSQTYKNFEFIIVNDKSTDNSLKIIRFYVAKDKRIKIIANDNNLSEAASANIGFQSSNGKYIARMDQDDIAHLERLEKQLSFLEKNPNHIVVGSQTHIIDEEGQVIGHKLLPTDHKNIYEEYGNFHPIIHPTVMIRRSLLPDKKKLWTNNIDSADDYLTLYTLLMNGKFANLPEKLLYYRLHSSNNSMKNVRRKFINSLRVRRHAVTELNYPLSPKMAIMIVLQSIYVLLLPEWISVGTYYLLKGIKPFHLAFPLLGKIKKRFIWYKKFSLVS